MTSSLSTVSLGASIYFCFGRVLIVFIVCMFQADIMSTEFRQALGRINDCMKKENMDALIRIQAMCSKTREQNRGGF